MFLRTAHKKKNHAHEKTSKKKTQQNYTAKIPVKLVTQNLGRTVQQL